MISHHIWSCHNLHEPLHEASRTPHSFRPSPVEAGQAALPFPRCAAEKMKNDQLRASFAPLSREPGAELYPFRSDKTEPCVVKYKENRSVRICRLQYTITQSPQTRISNDLTCLYSCSSSSRRYSSAACPRCWSSTTLFKWLISPYTTQHDTRRRKTTQHKVRYHTESSRQQAAW